MLHERSNGCKLLLNTVLQLIRIESNLTPNRDGAEIEGDNHVFLNEAGNCGQADRTSTRQSLLSLSSEEATTANDDQILGQEEGRPASSSFFESKPLYEASVGRFGFYSFIWAQWLYEILACITAILALAQP